MYERENASTCDALAYNEGKRSSPTDSLGINLRHPDGMAWLVHLVANRSAACQAGVVELGGDNQFGNGIAADCSLDALSVATAGAMELSVAVGVASDYPHHSPRFSGESTVARLWSRDFRSGFRAAFYARNAALNQEVAHK